MKVYETTFLIVSFSEEVKLFLLRLQVLPQKEYFKTPLSYNLYDTMEKFSEEAMIMTNNYKIIMNSLEDFPHWQEKFQIDFSKQISYSNIKKNFPVIYEIVQQQVVFK